MNSRARRRRRNTKETKLSASNKSYVISSLSAVSIILFIAFFAISSGYTDTLDTVFAALGTIFMFVSVVFIFWGVKEFKDVTRNTISRIFVLILPVISFFAWLMIYIIGYLNK